MNVLSLFDGMSCGRIALDQLGIKVDTYYACEIDKFAMQVSNKNYPNIIQLGDVTKVKGVDLKNIDLIIGGSPCQGFSFAGKQLAFDDPRSALFFEFIRLKEECKPKYFLLENVRMKREHEDIISEYTGFEPIIINSSKLSAQNRVRLYWTNIPNITQPIDKGIVLKDILQNTDSWGEQPRYLKNKWNGVPRGNLVSEVNEKGSCLSATMYKGQIPLYVKKESIKNDALLKKMTTDEGKAYCLTASYGAAEPNNSLQRKQRTMIPKQIGIAIDIKGHDQIKRVYSEEGKSPTLTTCTGGHREPKVACGRMIGRHKINGIRQDSKGSIAGKSKQMLELRKDEKTNTLSTVSKDNVLVTSDPFEVYWRKLTPIECERLQTVPDKYTEGVSKSQRYRMLGNGWTVEVIKHIFKNMNTKHKPVEPNFKKQQNLF